MDKKLSLNKIKIAMVNANVSAKELSAALQVPIARVYRWRSNTYQPDLLTLIAIAHVLRVPLNALLNTDSKALTKYLNSKYIPIDKN